MSTEDMSSDKVMEMPPPEVVEAAETVTRWAKQNNISDWMLGECASRSALEQCRAELERLKHAVQPFVRLVHSADQIAVSTERLTMRDWHALDRAAASTPCPHVEAVPFNRLDPDSDLYCLDCGQHNVRPAALTKEQK